MARRTHDDEHSVDHYHRQLHTLKEISAHPTGDGASGREGANGRDGASGRDSEGGVFPVSAFRVSGSSTVRLTESGTPPVPPVPPPPVPYQAEHPSYADARPEAVPATLMS